MLEIPSLTAALGGKVRSFGVLLTASDETTAERLAQREIGTALEEHIERSTVAAAKLDSFRGAHRVATDGRPVTEIAGEIVDASEWLRG